MKILRNLLAVALAAVGGVFLFQLIAGSKKPAGPVPAPAGVPPGSKANGDGTYTAPDGQRYWKPSTNDFTWWSQIIGGGYFTLNSLGLMPDLPTMQMGYDGIPVPSPEPVGPGTPGDPRLYPGEGPMNA